MESQHRKVPGRDVCVVGAGMIGLLATKNLKEQGFSPAAFTKDDYIGGLWRVSEDPTKTTATAQTLYNSSKEVNAFTDYPMPESYPTHPTAKQLQEYLEGYARHFDLLPHIRTGKIVINIERDEADAFWMVTTEDTTSRVQETHRFDRVVIATGCLNIENDVKVEGQELFGGEIIHSRAFKDPSRYEGKNVLVIGTGATGADTLVSLRQAGAGRLYSSHRGQYFLLPRTFRGLAVDHGLSRRIGYILRYIASWSPTLCAKLMSAGMMSTAFQAYPFLKKHPAWAPSRGKPPSLVERLPVFSDHLADYLRDGLVEDVVGVERVTGPRSVRLTDGVVIDDLDAIIVCTGYHYDLSCIEGNKGDPFDPAFAPDGYASVKAAPFNPLKKTFPRLYRGIISEQYPESLAVCGHFIMPKAVFTLYDLATMAIAGFWSRGEMPSRAEMGKDIDAQYAWLTGALRRGPVPHWGIRINARETYAWLNEMAGTGIDRLGGWGWGAWKLWWRDRKFYSLVMDGVDSPASYRLIDTGRGRAPWAGARERIEKDNVHVKALGETWKRENEEDKKRKQV